MNPERDIQRPRMLANVRRLFERREAHASHRRGNPEAKLQSGICGADRTVHMRAGSFHDGRERPPPGTAGIPLGVVSLRYANTRKSVLDV